MGNKVCCEETRTHGVLEKEEPQIKKHPVIVEHRQPIETIEIPKLTPQVEQTIVQKNQFKQEEANIANPHIKKYGQDVYVGQLDEYGLKPNGFGKMYKSNHSIYIGHFNHGKAQGKGLFVFADGSFYQGEFNKNCAQSKDGVFISQAVYYVGGFRKNTFEGHGVETGKDNSYVFEGQFHNGSRTKGTVKWGKDHAHVYTGSFNQQNQFNGKGILKEAEGTYEGDFLNGEKHGKGIYKAANGTRYEGDYFQGFREGHGTIYQPTGQIAYTGMLKKGLPHGKGSMISKEGKMLEATWVEGLDSNLLPK